MICSQIRNTVSQISNVNYQLIVINSIWYFLQYASAKMISEILYEIIVHWLQIIIYHITWKVKSLIYIYFFKVFSAFRMRWAFVNKHGNFMTFFSTTFKVKNSLFENMSSHPRFFIKIIFKLRILHL